MKVLLINGSPHEHGCTRAALDEVARTLSECGVETELINLGAGPFSGCRACGGCAKVVDFYKTNFGMLNSYMAEELRQTYDEWSSQSEEPGGIIIKAMQIALSKNVRNWKFVCGVLRQWEGKARTLADAETLEVEHKNRQCRQREAVRRFSF